MRSYKKGNIKLFLIPASPDWLFIKEAQGKAKKIVGYQTEESAILHYETEILNTENKQLERQHYEYN